MSEPAGLPRLLKGLSTRGALNLDEHLAVHGYAPRQSGRRQRRSQSGELIEQVERSGLRGRGGASFPTAVKLRAVAHGRGRPVVVLNAVEAEPASSKDRTLMGSLPHLALDGGVLAARAVGAEELIVCVPAGDAKVLQAVSVAQHERADAYDAPVRVSVRGVPDRYVAGQETAVINMLNGGPSIPTFTPPLPAQCGVRRQPTLVSNAETLAHLALIARHGASWFRRLGTATTPGSTLVTIHGPLTRPGVYEIEQGTPLSSLIADAGGLVAPLRAALLGGYAGGWVDADAFDDVYLSPEDLAAHGVTLGPGVVVLLSAGSCPVAEVTRVVRWLAGESAGQCGPCVHGLSALAAELDAFAAGDPMADEARVERLLSAVRRRGACAHPDGAARFVASALDVFAPEFADHATYGRCAACDQRPELPLPVHGPRRAPPPAAGARVKL